MVFLLTFFIEYDTFSKVNALIGSFRKAYHPREYVFGVSVYGANELSPLSGFPEHQ